MSRKRSPKSRISILIGDVEAVFRLGLRKLFSVEDDLRVVAQAENSQQVVAMAKSFNPNLAFIQAEIFPSDFRRLVGEVRHQSPATRIVVVASKLANQEADQFVRGGAAGAIARASDPALFVKYARKVAAGEICVPDSNHGPDVQPGTPRPRHAARPVETLTRREKTIISGLTQGWRNREIAECLSITEQTVKNHLRSIYDKVGVSDRLELVLYAIHQRLELPPLPVPAIQSQ